MISAGFQRSKLQVPYPKIDLNFLEILRLSTLPEFVPFNLQNINV